MPMARHITVHPANPQPRLIRQAAEILRGGGVIAYPTDSSYALGCHIGDADAARRIRQIRGVGDDHFLTLVLRDLAEIGHFARLDNWQFRIIRRGTREATRSCCPPRARCHGACSTPGAARSASGSPGIRWSRRCSPSWREPILSSTLILPDESEPLNDADAILEAIGNQLDLVIDAGACPAEPTTVIDLAVPAGRQSFVAAEGILPGWDSK